MLRRLLLAAAVGCLTLVGVAGASVRASYADRVVGAEFPPITSTLGTFRGVAIGALPGQWRVQIVHQPLASGPSVAITGGTFVLHALSGRVVAGQVVGGSVIVVSRGVGCRNQVYAVDARLSAGQFGGTLTHYRRTILGRCVVYSATISGSATFLA